MEERYNVYFTGQVMDGFDLQAVRDKLAKVFNADQATLDKLFSGKAQLIKRDCDAATATKFRQALERAGAIPIIKLAASTADAAATAPTPAPARAMTAAERIAALAAAPDETRFQKSESGGAPVYQATVASPAAPDTGGIALAPVGTAVLREEERAQPVIAEVDISGLAIDIAATRLSDERPPAPPAPDTGHLSMGAVGETIPNLRHSATLLSPNLDGMALSAPGTDFSDCIEPAPPPPSLDLSYLAALPPGDMPLEEQHRRPIPVATPTIDHISLAK